MGAWDQKGACDAFHHCTDSHHVDAEADNGICWWHVSVREDREFLVGRCATNLFTGCLFHNCFKERTSTAPAGREERGKSKHRE